MAKNDFKSFSAEARKVIKTFPREMGKALLLSASDNFRRQGYEDDNGSVHQWAPRKRKMKRGARQRALLVQSGRLRRSPRITATTATSVTVGTDVGYAEPLQEGNAKMPARPYLVLGKSSREKLKRTLTAKITAALR